MENNENTSVETTQEVKTYTQEEVMALLQSESDKRVSQALKTQQKKYEKEMSLSKLDANERARVESADRIAELEQQLAELQKERNKSELRQALTARGLSGEFADILALGEDAQSALDNVEALDRLFKASVKEEVEKRLAGAVPKGNGNSKPSKSIKEMSLAELQASMN